MRLRRSVPLVLPGLVVIAAGVLIASCADQTGPRQPIPGRFALAPGFVSAQAGIVPVGGARVVLTRVADGTVARDTVIAIAAGSDSVDLAIGVAMLAPDEAFLLTLTLMSPAGDTVFRAGPIEVRPTTSGPPAIVQPQLVYVGVGANAAAVVLQDPTAPFFSGDTLPVVAVALDSSGAPIPGTPIGWRSLDSTIAQVPAPGQGRVVGRGVRGAARIVAQLLTGPADTTSVTVALPPAALTAESGGGQSGPAGGLLPTPLVARVTASDGVGIAGQWIRFAATLGGGALSADSVLTDATGRASVSWTLGNVVGAQTVTATTARLPGVTATFGATSVATGPGAITIVAGNAQSALVGTAVATAPQVRVTDTQGNPVPGVTVTFVVTQGGGAVTGAAPVTDGNGLAAVGSWTLGPTIGLNALTATVTGLTPLQFVALGTGTGGATSMTISAGNGQTALAGTAVPIPPAVLVTDTSGAPIVGVTVTFAVTAGGGSLTGAAAVTNASGVATVGSWTLGTPGSNTLTASLTGLPTVAFTATATVGPPATVVIISGNNQSADAGTALPQPLVVEVQDSVGNPVSGTTITWAALYGALAPTSGTTDAAGRAQTTWTLGINAITQTATATASGLTPAVFTATAVFPNPSILLALAGTDRIRLTDSVALNVTLTAPAPVNGVVVLFSVDNPAVVGLDTTDLFIPQNGTSTQTKLYGLASGTTTVRATAAGYADGAVSVLVTVQVLSMPTALNVPFGGTASLPLQISTPAPVGGVPVTVVSSNPSAVGVTTPTVTIPEGQQTANATVSGVAPGTATITASTATFGLAQSVATTRANLNILDGSVTIPATFTDTVTVRLESNSVPIAAPSPGVQVTFTSRNPNCVAATSPVTIPTGLVSTTSIISYAGVAATPCNGYVVAEAPAIQPDSVFVTVNAPPGITVNGPYTVGAGLQRYGDGYLGATNHGGVNVVIKSGNPAVAKIALDDATVGGDSLVRFVANGQNYFTYYLQAVEGVADTGVASVPVTVTAPGFTTRTVTHSIRRMAFQVEGVPTTTTTLSDSTPFYVQVGYVQPGYPYLWEVQAVRAGAQPLTVTLRNDTLGVGRLITTAKTADTVTVQIQPRFYYSPTTVAGGGAAFDPLAAGATSITATLPGADPTPYATRPITVSAPAITVNGPYTVGAGLQRYGDGYLGATSHGGVNVVIKSGNPAVAKIALDDATVGGDSLVRFVANGQNYFTYYLQAVEGVADTGVASVPVTVTAPGFTTGTATHSIRRPAFQLENIPASLTTLSDSAPFYVQVGYTLPSYGFLWEVQAVRAGAQPLTVTLRNDTPGVGRLITTAKTADTVTVQIQPRFYYSPTTVAGGGAAFDPLTAGTTSVTGSIPGYDPTNGGTRSITVSAPGMTMYETTVGSGLQKSWYGLLNAANHGGVNVVVKSSAPSVARLAPDESTAGTDSLVIFVPNGQQYFYYFVQGMEGQTGTVTTTARASGFTDGSTALNVVRSAVGVYALPASVSAQGDSVAFYAQVGIPYGSDQYMSEVQAVRAGGSTLTVTLASSVPTVGVLMTSTQTRRGSVTVQIQPGLYYSPTTVATGGAGFKGLTAGTTVVSSAIPGYVTLLVDGNRTVSVTP